MGPCGVGAAAGGNVCAIAALMAAASRFTIGTGATTPCIAPGAIPGGAQGGGAAGGPAVVILVIQTQ